ncbi:type I-E CRISPR-associated protein Cas5/CasD [Glycomyces harbinensis]|uniref:CRISPR system Cascade subunit CasD n=1 Tax=Glycomyces harbinensis TaxID=58114 RepID=A0A1G6RIJ6_9ACTN|nr:type I-E CRISPR-associated protein Cas5/CasD [Glycomyces harbinensis]SDD04479.1 CRISPR system Cascade subunit CasD [Glycomyces harbinensis]
MSVSVLLLRLAGPMQSWGDRPAMDTRMTGRVPTKSGVIGLLGAALGLERGADLEKLRELRMGVRVDRRGRLLRDFHTASNYEWIGPKALQPKNLPRSEVNAAGMQQLRTGKTPMTTVQTWRYYLQDASFLVGLEGEREFLGRLDEAVRRPWFPLALGRRSCPPAGRVSLGVKEGESLVGVLRSEPWAPRTRKERSEGDEIELEFVWEDEDGEELVRDVPVSFAPTERAWRERAVTRDSLPVKVAGSSAAVPGPPASTVDAEHDPLWWTE